MRLFNFLTLQIGRLRAGGDLIDYCAVISSSVLPVIILGILGA